MPPPPSYNLHSQTVLFITLIYKTSPPPSLHQPPLSSPAPTSQAITDRLMLYSTELYWALLHSTELYCILLSSTELYCILLNSTALYWTLLHSIKLYGSLLHSTRHGKRQFFFTQARIEPLKTKVNLWQNSVKCTWQQLRQNRTSTQL